MSFSAPFGAGPLRVDWDPSNAAMETAIDPIGSNWQLIIDGGNQPAATMTWVSGTRFTIASPGFPASVDAELRQLQVDPGVQNTNGIFAAPPNSFRILI